MRSESSITELTLRSIIIGAIINIIFTVANVYMGLKLGLTFGLAIPAAVISMAILSLFGSKSILENNIVQTQVSASTISSVVFIFPSLVMVKYWHSFSYWQVFSICAAGGMMGVLFTIPLRRALVVNSSLPYPEGVATAQLLQAGRDNTDDDGLALKLLINSSIISGLFAYLSSSFRIFSAGLILQNSPLSTIVRFSYSFSLGWLAAGYMMGIAGGVALLVGLFITWGIAIPAIIIQNLQSLESLDSSGLTTLAYQTWAGQVRYIGIGVMAVAAVWLTITLLKPMVCAFLGTANNLGQGEKLDLRQGHNLSLGWIIFIMAAATAILVVVFAAFLMDSNISATLFWALIAYATICACGMGLLMVAASGYMAGLFGIATSPISGIATISIIVISFILLASGLIDPLLASADGKNLIIATIIFITSAIVAMAVMSNNSLQEYKTGYLVGANPRSQQIALLIGCVTSAMVFPPVLNLLYNAYGFSGAMPHAGMNEMDVLAAPQAAMLTTIINAVFNHSLPVNMIMIGGGLAIVLIIIDSWLRNHTKTASLSPLVVGIAIYIPWQININLVTGAILSFLIMRHLRKMAANNNGGSNFVKNREKHGVLIASGLIIGGSLFGLFFAAMAAFYNSPALLNVPTVKPSLTELAVLANSSGLSGLSGFANISQYVVTVAIIGVIIWIWRSVVKK